MTDEKRSHKLWGGRFAAPTDEKLDALNRSITVDYRLWPADIRLSQAWAMALCDAGVVNLEEGQQLERGLTAVAKRLQDGERPHASDEDVHTMIDRLLHEEAGDVASKLHTGRSRNDQVATATRLWTIEAVSSVDALIQKLQQTLIDHAERLQKVYMPAYTHLQRAQPVAAAHWVLSHFWPLDRDRSRLSAVARSAAVLPLGSGAIAGSAYPISRVLLQGSLGFTSLSQNSIDAVGDRDFVAETLFAVTLLATHLSRLAEDLILYGSSEFAFVKFGERFTTGSSMMPQKRNPDALELARASAPRVFGDLVTMLGVLKGLPSGYNKDLQEDKKALFDAIDHIALVLPAVNGTMAELSFDDKRMSSAISSTMMATDLADYLVRKGSTFRQAHEAVGSLIREAEMKACELGELPLESFTAANTLFHADVFEWLEPARSVSARNLAGGTGPEAVSAQIEAARQSLTVSSSLPPGNEPSLLTV